MKKFVVLILLLGVAGLANAGLELGLNGELVDIGMPPVSVVASEGQTATVGLFLGATGGALDISAAVNNVNQDAILAVDDPDILALLGVDSLIFLDLAIPAYPPVIIADGAAVDGIGVDLTGAEAIITLIDGDTFEVLDTATIPEPMTFALLGLGGLFLRRRK